VAIGGQVDYFLAQFSEQRVIVVVRAMGAPVRPIVT
jgi:hypothetical protein